MSRTRAFFFLCRCLSELRETEAAALAEEIRCGAVGWERVVEVSSEYLITVTLYCALARKELLDCVPAELLDYWEAIHDLNRARNLDIIDQVVEIAGILNRIGVEPLVFKGAGQLVAGLYPDPAMRIMYDIDILVPEDRAVECGEGLLASGYQALTAGACNPDLHFHGPALRREGRAAAVELHHLSPWPQLLTTGALHDNSQLVMLQGVRLRTPSATAALIIAIAHGYVQHASKKRAAVPLRDIYDTALLMRKTSSEIDWSRVIAAFADAGEMDALRTHNLMLHRLFGQSIPGVSGEPRAAWLYWRLCLLGIRNPVVVEMAAQYIANCGELFANSDEGRRFRKQLITPSTYRRKLKRLRTALQRRSGLEGAFKS